MKKLTIERKFLTPVEKVWEAFTTSEILIKWWSPKGMSCSHASIELKEGGLFHFCFKEQDGNEFWGRGIYQSIQAPNLISYIDSYADKDGNAVAPKFYGMPGEEIQKCLIEFKFSTENNTTLMNVTMDNHYDDSMTKQMIQGWNEMFDNLALLIEK